MKRIIVILSFLTLAIFSGCLKDDAPIDFGSLEPILEIPDGGLTKTNFDEGYLKFSGGDTITFTFDVNLASVNVRDEDLTVELGVSAAKLSEYNALGTGITFETYPEDGYIFENSTVTIPAGDRTAEVTIKFVESTSLMPNVSYMLPLSILNAEGLDISDNFGTKYFYTLGVCVAGIYQPGGKRIEYAGNASDSVVSSTITLDGTSEKFMSVLSVDAVSDAISADTVQVAYADLGSIGWFYNIVFNCDADSIISVTPNETMRKQIPLNSFVVYEKSYDPVLKQFFLKTGYKSSSRKDRITSEFLTLK